MPSTADPGMPSPRIGVRPNPAALSQERVAQRGGNSANAYRQYERAESKPGTPANMALRNIVALSHVTVG